ncbi:glycoside hydrolase family 25 protein [Methylocystis sp. WRRC1]|uniref:glycoside hydrolase family 25 protein n=1 Tax=unclassified Methylocystis TaxID=2625913 RepID=UPI0001F86CF5|nr:MULTISPECIES: GH25 family lysozyme [unclassified Methylocystis]MCC3244547.1 glycoside hydrolase family 25 protein [Methylocystis sp. WRRC1]
MRSLKCSLSRLFALACVAASGASLVACGSAVDPGYARRPRFATSAPLMNAKRDPSFLAYAVPESELHNFPATRSAEFAVHGIDVSKYQGDIDWQAVKDSGVAFAFIKATEGGDRTDSKFQYNWAAAKAAGVPRGAYHFVYWCRPPHEEIGNFASVVPNDPDALPPVLDVEATPESKSCKRTLYREEALRDMRAMLEQMERHYGKRPIIYSSVDFYQAILHSDALSEYPIWVRSTKYHPKVRYGDRKWTFWQYRSDGRVPGIPGAVDQNTFNGSYDQWRSWLASQTGLKAAPMAAVAKPVDDRGAKQLIEEDPAMLPAADKGAGASAAPTPPAAVDNPPDKG